LALKRPGDGLASYEKALGLSPNHVNALINRGAALRELKRPKESLASYEKALAIHGDSLDALRGHANMLREMRQGGAAIEGYDRALALDPLQPEVLNNRGNALADLNKFEEALASYDAALKQRPDYLEAMINRGNVLMDMRRVDEALVSYDAVLAIDPQSPDAHWNKGLIHLALGDFDQGWAGYEWRSRKKTDNDVRVFDRPRWSGAEPVFGKTVLLHAEQGFGDTIQFIRYAPVVAGAGATVIVEAPTPLRRLIEDVEGVSTVIARGEPVPGFDLHCPLLSTPLAFRTTLETVPADIPYLRAEPDLVERWRERLSVNRSLRVGIAWTGNPTHRNDRNRSIALRRMVGALSSDPRVQLIGVQRDVRDEDRETLRLYPDVLSLGGALTDFSDTAAVISLLDLVISVDTSVAHLAGALGQPVWILLPYNGDWRWMLEGETSIWYPTAKLFRQPKPGDWDSVLTKVAAELSGYRL
jgi:Tfp pilus assembly protein PilF